VDGLKLKLGLLLVLFACAPVPTLEELEDEAMLTGDWSKVEAREKRLKYEQEYRAAEQYCKEQNKLLICLHRGGPARIKDCGCGSLR
jgi:hypothetical protein